jgi:hypothetical protein
VRLHRATPWRVTQHCTSEHTFVRERWSALESHIEELLTITSRADPRRQQSACVVMRVERERERGRVARAPGPHVFGDSARCRRGNAERNTRHRRHTHHSRHPACHAAHQLPCHGQGRPPKAQNAEVWARGAAPHGECDPAALETKRGRENGCGSDSIPIFLVT